MNRPTRWSRAAVLSAAALCLLSLTGCFGVDGSFKHLRDTTIGDAVAVMQVETEFGVGPLVLGLARKVVSWSDDADAEVALDLLQQVQKVQVGVYTLDGNAVTSASLSYRERTLQLLSHLVEDGYDAIIRNYEGTTGSLILVKAEARRPGKVREILIVSLEGNQLSLIQLRGNVNAIVEIAAREHDLPGVDAAMEQAK